MIRFMLQKLTHKKWMVCCLLIGNILLIAVAASCPMYKNAAAQRMLTDGFSNYLEETNQDPGMLTLHSYVEKELGFSSYIKLRDYAALACEDLKLTADARCPVIEYKYVTISSAVPLFERSEESDERKLQISAMNDLNEHIHLISGKTAETQMTEDGFIEVIVSSYTFTKNKLMLGDEFEFSSLSYEDGTPVCVRIVGVFENDENEDGYWLNSSDSYSAALFMDPSLYDSVFVETEDHRFLLNAYWYVRFDYSQIRTKDVDYLTKKLPLVQSAYHDLYAGIKADGLQEVMDTYEQNIKKISVTLMILEVPVLVLLCAFLYMISDQMLQLERNEISQLKSRGAGRGQIFMIYLLQSSVLALISLVVGLGLGGVLCRAIGSANAFLEFVSRRNLAVQFNAEVILYAVAAMVVSIGMTVIPVIRYSKVTIVNLKQNRARVKSPLWQRLGLDFIILAVGCYGYYSFSQQEEALLAKVIGGETLDPLLYLSSSLFILGAGMVAVRLQPLCIRLLYRIGVRRWKPAAYTSFLQTIRTGARQNFIMVFLVLTVALGIFNATVARTILSNAEENVKYVYGADIVLMEQWRSNEGMVNLNPEVELVYYEPDYGKYQELDGIEALTKVYHYTNCTVRKTDTEVLGIITNEFGLTAPLDEKLLSYDYYDYLNVLALNASAAVVSANYHNVLGYELGDMITVENSEGKSIVLTIYGFVSYWPGYVPSSMQVLPDGSVRKDENYLVIANFSTVREGYGERPYEIWMRLKPSVSEKKGTGYLYDWAEENEIVFTYFSDITAQTQAIRTDTLFQGTNGVLTMSFIIILVLCVVGFLIYWILSIRSRELLFGVFRAMGMSKGEILKMLVNEQLFSSIPAIVLGAAVGFAASYLFVPLLQIAYASDNQILPLQITTLSSDMFRLFSIIIIMLLICLLVLARQVFKMKISQALKLGED